MVVDGLGFGWAWLIRCYGEVLMDSDVCLFLVLFC